MLHRGRKRRRDDAHEDTSSSRRRRFPGPTDLSAVPSFGISVALADSTHRRGKRRQDDNATSSTRLRRCRISRRLGPSQFLPVRSFCLRVALATAPRGRRRERRAVDARRPVSTSRSRRSRRILLPSRFPGLRPFALRFLLNTGASESRRRRKPAMGNLVTRLLGKSTSDDVLGVPRGRIEGSQEVRDPTVEPELEAEMVRRGIGDWSVPALKSWKTPEKIAPNYKEASERTKWRDGRLQEAGFEAKLHEFKLAELPGVPTYRAKEDLDELFTPLTDKDDREVNSLLYDSGCSDRIIVVHEPSNIEVTKEKLQCLRPRGWLNDEVINLYIELLKERAEREPKRFLKCHFFNTFFYKKLTCGISGYDYQSVRRWTTSQKLGYRLIDCEKIFVPVHRDVHWCLAVINMKDKTFQYLDSLGGMGHDVLSVLARYIMDEWKDKSNIEIDPSSWMEVSDFVPLQQNGWDCGMFMLKFIDFHSRGLKPSFSQEDMMYFRKRTAKEIMRLRAD